MCLYAILYRLIYLFIYFAVGHHFYLNLPEPAWHKLMPSAKMSVLVFPSMHYAKTHAFLWSLTSSALWFKDLVIVWLGGVVLVRMEWPCVVLRRPQALDCRVLIPPEAWKGLLLLHVLLTASCCEDLPLPRPVWDSNLGPPASGSRSFRKPSCTSRSFRVRTPFLSFGAASPARIRGPRTTALQAAPNMPLP